MNTFLNRKMLKQIALTGFLILTQSLSLNSAAMSQTPPEDEREILAHRGASGMYPQSTWLAFDKALEQGADILEMDVHLSKDGVVIVNHDADFTKTTGSDAKVEDLTLADIKLMDAGYAFTRDDGNSYPFRAMGLEVLTLREVMEFFPDQRLNIEMKANKTALAEALWQLITEFNLQNKTAVASQHTKAMNRFRDVSAGQVQTSATIAELTAASVAWSTGFGWAYSPKFELAQIPYAIITKPYLDWFRKKGVRTHIWTVNDSDEIKRAFDLGADGVIGDYPDRIYQDLVNRGERAER